MSLQASHLRCLTFSCAALALAGASGCSSDDSNGGSGGNGGGTPGEFLALTYNVAGLPEGLTSSPNPLARMPIIGQLLNDYDLDAAPGRLGDAGPEPIRSHARLSRADRRGSQAPVPFDFDAGAARQRSDAPFGPAQRRAERVLAHRVRPDRHGARALDPVFR